VQYQAVVERERGEIALLSAAYYDPDWRWVQSECLAFRRSNDHYVGWVAATCLGHLARIHRQLDLELALQRLTEMRTDPLVESAVNDALDDIRFFLKFQ